MKQKTEKSLDEQRCIVAYLDSFRLSRDLRQARLASLRELQSATGEELRPLFGRTLMASILDKGFKPLQDAPRGEL